MREYSIVRPGFWTGETGKSLRGNADAQRVALYLLTNSRANMIGLYEMPLVVLCHEVGMTSGGASKALQRLSEAAFAFYDAPSEWLYVPCMAAHQIGPELKAADKRVKSIVKLWQQARKSPFYHDFLERYRDAYHLEDEGPSKPLRSQEQEQDQDQKKETPAGLARAQPQAPAGRGSRLPDDWAPSEIERQFAISRGMDPERVDRTAERFRNHWLAKAGKDASKRDWAATWRNWVTKDLEDRPPAPPARKREVIW